MLSARLGSDKHQFYKSLVWLDRGPNPRPSAQEACTLPIQAQRLVLPRLFLSIKTREREREREREKESERERRSTHILSSQSWERERGGAGEEIGREAGIESAYAFLESWESNWEEETDTVHLLFLVCLERERQRETGGQTARALFYFLNSLERQRDRAHFHFQVCLERDRERDRQTDGTHFYFLVSWERERHTQTDRHADRQPELTFAFKSVLRERRRASETQTDNQNPLLLSSLSWERDRQSEPTFTF